MTGLATRFGLSTCPDLSLKSRPAARRCREGLVNGLGTVLTLQAARYTVATTPTFYVTSLDSIQPLGYLVARIDVHPARVPSPVAA